MTIKVEIKNVYGKELVYPICEKAKILCSLTGAKTFTNQAIQTIKLLGYVIEVVTTKTI